MWLNKDKVSEAAIEAYRRSLIGACPKFVVIDNLFAQDRLKDVMQVLRQEQDWHTQQHSYSALYVDEAEWQKTSDEQRFVQRDVWRPQAINVSTEHCNVPDDFLLFLRGTEFMALLSRIFKVELTDMNVAEPKINSNYFRLGPADFVAQHADDSPGREVCMLLYLNKQWHEGSGGELIFMGKDDKPISIQPLYNRCVLFDPFSEGSEHWVANLKAENTEAYRYNVTSWYWSE